ncbi:MAG: mannose-6-phosphate isomerase [Robiginitomaculum sp.]|nr:MAG: mannose-6-phosphate isomerase [Robiginitomaculum sp.]
MVGKRHSVKPGENGRLVLEQKTLPVRQWLKDKALPFWAKNAIDDAGGFCEELAYGGTPNWQAVRRLRVQARQVYAYSLAHELGWYAGQPIARRTMNFMLTKGFMPDGSAGFISLLNPDYSVKDPRRDLYDHAFYLLALAWQAKVGAGRAPLALADTILLFLDQNLIADNGGYLEGLPQGDPRNALRRQNPHMHMFEALMSLYDASGAEKYLHRAAQIFELFKQYFFDERTATITEYFHQDWRAARGKQGQSVEPGHMAEWVWLLGQYTRRTAIDTRPWANKLYQKLCGYDTLLLPDEMNKDGQVLRSTRRLWVQTEMVKAHLAQAENGETDSYRLAAAGIEMLASKYLRPDGTWLDALGENGLPVIGAIPTSTFYHIMCMVAESCRVSGLDSVKPKVQIHG